MAEFGREDLRGSTFDWTDLSGSTFRAASLNNVTIRGTDLHHVKMTGVELWDVDISGEVSGLRINGVDVTPLRRGGDGAPRPRPGEDAPRRPRRLPRGLGPARGAVGRHHRPGPTASTRRCCTSRSTASGRSSRRCATSAFATDCVGPPAIARRPVAVAPARPAVGRGARRPGRPARPRRAGRRWTRCSSCAATGRATVRRVLDGLTEESLDGDTTPPAAPGGPRPARSR